MALISASILASRFAHLESECRAALAAGADWIHIDVMDGHFVPNITMGPVVVRALKPIADDTGALLDVHLMIENPERYVDDFAAAGADVITVHAEASLHLHRVLHQIKETGRRAGVSLNPATPIRGLDEVLTEADIFLVMSVNPGFAGQKFIQSTVDRIRRLRRRVDEVGAHALIEVDGGVKAFNIGSVVQAGADVCVVSSGIFHGDIEENLRDLRQAIGAVHRA